VIASDTGDLMLDTGSFEYSNIKSNDRSYNVGGGVNVGGNSSKAGDGPVKNKVTYNVSGNYGFSDSRQTNFATIGEGTITVRDTSASLGAGGSSIGNTDEYSGLKRDVSKAQYSTMDLGVQLSADKDMFNMILRSVDTFGKTMDGLSQIVDRGRKIEEQTHVAEKTGNWIEYGDFEVAGDLKMTQEEYKEWQVYKQFEKKSGVDVDFSIDGVIVSEKDVKVSNIIRDLDRIQEYNDSDKVDILGNMSKEPLSPTHGEDAQIWIWATYPYYLSGKKHSGVDLGTVINSKVTAISGGTAVVHYTGEYNGKGINNVTITDSGGNSVIYKHTTYSNTISNGQWIDSGKIIGTLDKSGQAAGLWNGSHLHLQVDNKKGSNSNPLYYIFKNQPNLKWNFPSKKVEQDIKTRNPELYDSIKKYGTGEKGL